MASASAAATLRHPELQPMDRRSGRAAYRNGERAAHGRRRAVPARPRRTRGPHPLAPRPPERFERARRTVAERPVGRTRAPRRERRRAPGRARHDASGPRHRPRAAMAALRCPARSVP
jgi:hypothetical protein